MGKGHTKLLNEVKGNHKVKLKKDLDASKCSEYKQKKETKGD